jgi:hypothetical protein
VRRASLASLLALAAAALPPAVPAGAAAPPPEPAPPPPGPLWATINVCDSPSHPDEVGIRGQMPGDGRPRHVLFMRFLLQYASPDGSWVDVGPSGDSGWIRVGAADVRTGQAGTTFTIAPPTTDFELLRGVVAFQWRDPAGRIARRGRRLTTAGHPNTKGADPAAFSAASCELGP